MAQLQAMPMFDIYSKRNRPRKTSDTFKYDDIPRELRIQITYVLRDLIGLHVVNYYSAAEHTYQEICDCLEREYGEPKLAEGQESIQILFNFIQNTPIPDRVLDAIEVSMHVMGGISDPVSYKRCAYAKLSVIEAIEEINIRFFDHAVGYQFESGHMMRVDSQYCHEEVVKPALTLISDNRYAGAHEEFLNAHRHYRQGSYKECLNDCLKAFESTMKAICDIRGWAYRQTDTAKTLIDILAQNGLIPSLLLQHIGAVRATLEAGVPTMRNKLSGHGHGATPIAIPQYYAAYTLHLTASNIVFLVSAAKG
jgi:hypothetical protein